MNFRTFLNGKSLGFVTGLALTGFLAYEYPLIIRNFEIEQFNSEPELSSYEFETTIDRYSLEMGIDEEVSWMSMPDPRVGATVAITNPKSCQLSIVINEERGYGKAHTFRHELCHIKLGHASCDSDNLLRRSNLEEGTLKYYGALFLKRQFFEPSAGICALYYR